MLFYIQKSTNRIQPKGFNIPYDAERIHGISTELAEAEGVALSEVLEKFNVVLGSKYLAKFNIQENCEA
jgi:DNA polymerase-3 subunit alpha